MSWHSIAICAAGIIAGLASVAHGILLHRRIITPLSNHLREARVLPRTTVRLLSPILQVSTLAWFVGGALLVVASAYPADPLRPFIVIAVGIFYLHAAAANFIATQGRHFGWIPFAISVALLTAATAGGAK